MNGSVFRYKTKTGVQWGTVVELGRGPDGKRLQRRTRGYPDRDAATAALQAELVRRRQGTWIDPATDTLAVFLAQWLEVRAPHVAASSQKAYRTAAARIDPDLLATPLARLQRLRLQRWANALARRYAPHTVRQTAMVLAAALADAVEWKLLPDNPAAKLETPRAPKTAKRAWSAAQARAFLAAIDGDPDRALWRLLLDTGMRIGEALALGWADLDLGPAGGSVRVRRTLTLDAAGKTVVGDEPKSRSGGRTVPLAPETVAALRAHRAAQAERRLRLGAPWHDGGLAFDRGDGRFVWPATAGHRLDRAERAAGVPPLGPHGLRHTNATLLMEAGVPLKVIQERLGHASIAVTADFYVHVSGDADRAATDALRRTLAG